MNELELKETGYTILKKIIPIEDIEIFRNIMRECRENSQKFDHSIKVLKNKNNSKTIFNMGINNLKFDTLTKVFTYDKLNTFLQTITDDTLTYCHHFDIHVGHHGNRRKWHDDTQVLHENGYYGPRMKKYKKKLGKCPYDMMEPLPNGDTYKIYRVAIYLQDHQERGGLALFKGSHLNAKNREIVIPEIETGDVIIFDGRTIHTAYGFNSAKKNNNRMSIFFAVGKDNLFTEFHTNGAITRQSRQAKQKYILSHNVAKVLEQNNYKY